MDQNSSNIPKKIQLPCVLEVSGCVFLKGRTREMTDQEISVQCPNLAVLGAKKPKVGISGVLTFEFILYGSPREVLRIPCRVNYVSSIVVGLHININTLNHHQRQCFADLLTSSVNKE